MLLCSFKFVVLLVVGFGIFGIPGVFTVSECWCRVGVDVDVVEVEVDLGKTRRVDFFEYISSKHWVCFKGSLFW